MPQPVSSRRKSGPKSDLDRLFLALVVVAGGCAGVVVSAIVALLVYGADGAHGGESDSKLLDSLFVCFRLLSCCAGCGFGGVVGNRIISRSRDDAPDVCPECGVDRSVARGVFCETCQRHPKA